MDTNYMIELIESRRRERCRERHQSYLISAVVIALLIAVMMLG